MSVHTAPEIRQPGSASLQTEPPARRHQRGCERGLGKIGRNERHHAEPKAPLPPDEMGKPGSAAEIDHGYAPEHGSENNQWPCAEPAIGCQADEKRGGQEACEISPGWAEEIGRARGDAREDRKARGTFDEPEQDGSSRETGAEETSEPEHGE